jgi:uncharacterized protein YndB with AHSA1/START domain
LKKEMTMEQPRHYAEAAILIRRPAAEVFNAFMDPAVTTKFWFTKSSGKLDKGKTVECSVPGFISRPGGRKERDRASSGSEAL